jgi:cytoskeleton protein RodZ
MSTLGEELKAAREAKGITLSDIAEKTRISHTFLKAIEQDNYSVIPGDIFVVGFIKAFAKEVGLDPIEAAQRYKELRIPLRETPPVQQVQQAPKPSVLSMTGEAKRRIRGKGGILKMVIAGLVVGAALTGLAMLLTQEKPAPPPPPPAPVVQKPVPPPVFKPVSSAMKNMTTSAATAAGAHTAGPALDLVLTAADKSWYSYKADDGVRTHGLLTKGDELEIKADNKIILDLGNAGGINATLGGKPVKPFGRKAEAVKGIIISKDLPGNIKVPEKTPQGKNNTHQ